MDLDPIEVMGIAHTSCETMTICIYWLFFLSTNNGPSVTSHQQNLLFFLSPSLNTLLFIQPIYFIGLQIQYAIRMAQLNLFKHTQKRVPCPLLSQHRAPLYLHKKIYFKNVQRMGRTQLKIYCRLMQGQKNNLLNIKFLLNSLVLYEKSLLSKITRNFKRYLPHFWIICRERKLIRIRRDA